MILRKFAHVRQQENYDCGAACVATILEHYGIDSNLNELKDRLKTNGYGTSLLSISKLLNEVGLTNKVYNVNDSIEKVIRNIELPCLAVVNNGNTSHYIVIHKINGNDLVISDPLDYKIRKEKITKFKTYFAGILMVIYPSNNFYIESNKKSKLKNNYRKRFFNFLKGNKIFLFWTFVLSLLLTIFGVTLSYFTGILVDEIIPNNLTETLNFIALAFILLAIIQCTFQYFRDRLIVKTARKIEKVLTERYFSHLLQMPYLSIKNREVGEFISRFNDALTLTELFSNTLITAIVDLLLIFISGALLYYVSSDLFLVALMPIVLYIVITYLFFDKLSLKNRKVMEKHADVNAFFIQALNGIENIKSLNKENNIQEINKIKLYSYIDAGLQLDNTNVLSMYFKNIVQFIFPIMILWIGGKQILAAKLTLGALFTFISLMNYFFTSIQKVVNLQPYIQKAIVAAERFFDILDYNLIESCNKGEKINNKINLVDVRNLTFKYNDNNLIFNNVSLSIHRGETIAFVGQSGSGKSTLAKLLVKFLDVEDNSIFINGKDLNEIDVNSLRKRIFYISDKKFFVKGTILDNLCLGGDFKQSDIDEACKIACIYDFINELPGKYNFHLQENASNISLGQAQRLSLARALLHKPDVLILDEVISNIDKDNAISIMNNLKNIDIIKIFINHNIYLKDYYDKVYIFSDNNINLLERNLEVEVL
ncbi:pallidocin leader peptidase/ABC transporter [Aeribacillus pallidus]|nr:pallidocin leader peptidase/ABC transporter [Aeribacillus pallidus]